MNRYFIKESFLLVGLFWSPPTEQYLIKMKFPTVILTVKWFLAIFIVCFFPMACSRAFGLSFFLLMLHMGAAQIANCTQGEGLIDGWNLTQSGSFYQFNATDLNGNTVLFDKYEGKVLLVANTASFWGLTVSRFTQANQLKSMYASYGFEIIGLWFLNCFVYF